MQKEIEALASSPDQVADLFPNDVTDIVDSPPGPRKLEFSTDEEPIIAQTIGLYQNFKTPDIYHRVKRQQVLPTLDESSSSGDMTPTFSFDSDEGNNDRQEYARDSPSRNQNTQSSNVNKNVIHASSSVASRTQKIQELCDEAVKSANTGLEIEAIKLYKSALAINRSIVLRIKLQMQQLEQKHRSSVESISQRLKQDWIDVGLSIASIRTNMAVLYERLGDYKKAIASSSEAHKVYIEQAKELSMDGREFSHVEKMKENLREMVKKIEQARDSFEERRKYHEGIIRMRKILETTSDIAQRQNLYKLAENHAQLVLNLEAETLGEGHPQVADTYAMLSVLCFEQGFYNQAMQHLMKAFSIMKTSLGLQHPRTGQKLLEIARLYGIKHFSNEEKVVEYYMMAIEVFRLNPRCQKLVGSTLNDVAIVFIRRREYTRAIGLLADALSLYRTSCSKTSEGSAFHDVVQILQNLGECYLHIKKYNAAVDVYLNVLRMQRDARKQYDSRTASKEEKLQTAEIPMHLIDDECIADSLQKLGKSYHYLKDVEKALVVLQEALYIQRLAVRKAVEKSRSKTNPQYPAKQDRLAHTLYLIAEVQETKGNFDEAVRIYSESMQVRLFSDANKSEKRQNMVHCAMCLTGIGNVHLAKQEFGEAKKVFKEALSFCDAQGIPKEHKIQSMIRHRLDDSDRLLWSISQDDNNVATLESEALSCCNKGQYKEAIAKMTYAMEIRKDALDRLKASDDDVSENRYATACTLKKFGDILVVKGDTRSAMKAYNDSLKLLRKIGIYGKSVQISELQKLIGELNTS